MASLLDQRELARRAAELRERLNTPPATSWLRGSRKPTRASSSARPSARRSGPTAVKTDIRSLGGEPLV
jgi:hypothetical protein